MSIQYELRLLRIQCEHKQCESIHFQCALLSQCELTDGKPDYLVNIFESDDHQFRVRVRAFVNYQLQCNIFWRNIDAFDRCRFICQKFCCHFFSCARVVKGFSTGVGKVICQYFTCQISYNLTSINFYTVKIIMLYSSLVLPDLFTQTLNDQRYKHHIGVGCF